MSAERRTVLITGGAGFIGACLARALIADGHEVHLLLRAESATWRLAGLDGHYVAHRADLRDAAGVRAAVDACGPDVIYHAAAHGTLPSQKDRAAILAANVLGTAHLLDALEGHEYRRLVCVGSSSEYGHYERPMREDDRLAPRTDYAVAKAASTLLCLAEAARGRPVVAVRVFSAYGPWEDPSRLASAVMVCCAQGEAPRVTAGWQPRDFIHVEDVVALLRAAADSPRVVGEVLHAGTGQPQTVRDMVDTVVAVCGGGRIATAYGAADVRPDEPTTWVASIERTSALTGWRPRLDLRAGVEQMWAWFLARTGRSASAA
jgi:nucleoside-diphosphate-sugar epimerase